MIKNFIKKIPYSVWVYVFLLGLRCKAVTYIKVSKLKRSKLFPFLGDPNTNLIVSLTSFPERINDVWITIETIFQQEYKPWKVILVLAKSEFPNEELPESLDLQIKRGLEVLWVDKNTKSYKKLLPVRKKYPGAYIVTVDDDFFYETWRISELVKESKSFPNSIIGHRGWEVEFDNINRKLRPYREWKPANRNTPEGKIFITTGGGTLFPPNSLDDDILFDLDLIEKLCPDADDIWLWAVALKSGTPMLCLGNNKMQEVSYQRSTPALSGKNLYDDGNDKQLYNVFSTLNLFEFF